MTPHAPRLTAAALLAITLAGCGTVTPTSSRTPTPTPTPPAIQETPAPPITDRREINKQDNRSAKRRRLESQVMETRPLLDHLPITVGDVTIAIGGLAANNKTTLITIDPGSGSRARALQVYRDALRAHSDDGSAYEPQVTQ